MKIVQDIIAGAGTGARGETLQSARKKIISALEFLHVRIRRCRDLALTLQVAFLLKGSHLVTRQEGDFAARLGIQLRANARKKDVFVDWETRLIVHRLE